MQISTNIFCLSDDPITFYLDFLNYFEEVEGTVERMGFSSNRPRIQDPVIAVIVYTFGQVVNYTETCFLHLQTKFI